jgi:hypothetical protein
MDEPTGAVVPSSKQQETDMNAENAEIALLSDDELNAVAVGECRLDFTRVKCPIGHLEVTTTYCSSRLKGPPHVAASFIEMPAMTELARYLPM